MDYINLPERRPVTMKNKYCWVKIQFWLWLNCMTLFSWWNDNQLKVRPVQLGQTSKSVCQSCSSLFVSFLASDWLTMWEINDTEGAWVGQAGLDKGFCSSSEFTCIDYRMNHKTNLITKFYKNLSARSPSATLNSSVRVWVIQNESW